jgi:hypothetical protein
MILAGLSMAAAGCTGSVRPGARLARPAGTARGPCLLPDRLPDGGPLNITFLLCVLVVDGGITDAPWRSRSAGLSLNSEDTDACSPRSGTPQGTDLITQAVGAWALAALGGHAAGHAGCATPPAPGHERSRQTTGPATEGRD